MSRTILTSRNTAKMAVFARAGSPCYKPVLLSKMVRDIALPQLVSVWFQVLLTTLIGVLFIVQSPY
jgi:hypothetical protein